MIRGTTPTLNFTLPIQCSEITKCSVALAQNKEVVIEKKLSDCTTQNKVLSCCLTEDDTLELDCYLPVEIQLRVYCGQVKMASQIWKVPVGRILKDGCLL